MAKKNASKKIARIGIDARVHYALTRYLDHKRASRGRDRTETLASFTEQAILEQLDVLAPDYAERAREAE